MVVDPKSLEVMITHSIFFGKVSMIQRKDESLKDAEKVAGVEAVGIRWCSARKTIGFQVSTEEAPSRTPKGIFLASRPKTVQLQKII